jgi:ferredoxin-thioredoxin reductase catalytic subunit
MQIPKGMVLSLDTKTVELIKQGLEKRSGYCPCSTISDASTFCPCIEARTKRTCKCGLFIKDRYE